MFDSCLRNQFHHHKKKVAKKFRLRDTVVLLNKIKALIRLPSKSCSTENDLTFFSAVFLHHRVVSLWKHISSVDGVERRDQFVNLSKANVYSVKLCALLFPPSP